MIINKTIGLQINVNIENPLKKHKLENMSSAINNFEIGPAMCTVGLDEACRV